MVDINPENAVRILDEAAAASDFDSGTVMVFNQTAAPTGWTKDVSAGVNDRALRIVNGTVGTGGSNGFSTALGSSVGITGNTDGHSLTIAEIPAHTHNYNNLVAGSGHDAGGVFEQQSTATSSTGNGDTHSHTLTGATVDIDVQFIDFIIASKD